MENFCITCRPTVWDCWLLSSSGPHTVDSHLLTEWWQVGVQVHCRSKCTLLRALTFPLTGLPVFMCLHQLNSQTLYICTCLVCLVIVLGLLPEVKRQEHGAAHPPRLWMVWSHTFASPLCLHRYVMEWAVHNVWYSSLTFHPLKMKAVCSFRTSGLYNPVTASHYQNLHPWPQCYENLKFHICYVGQCLFMLRSETHCMVSQFVLCSETHCLASHHFSIYFVKEQYKKCFR